ncbi:uncharacterized protein LOC134203697 [Armigeres subalbatus]|uniref:uncharacterized protein LOC134203697 n=1 Tax=Armigeres subalbatus TaxID=124917 RepID=UPI002ED6416F
MSAQEAAWYLLRQPMSEASRKVEFIATMWPQERIKSKKRNKQMDEEDLDDNSTDVWTLNIIQRYELRRGMDDICLADFAAYYSEERSTKHSYRLRLVPRVLRWCSYSMAEMVDYKREMVLLFLPFRNEVCDVLDRNKFLKLYEDNEAAILAKHKEYDCEMNLDQVVEEYIRSSSSSARSSWSRMMTIFTTCQQDPWQLSSNSDQMSCQSKNIVKWCVPRMQSSGI